MNSIDNAILNALFNREQEISVTTPALVLKLKNAGVEASDEQMTKEISNLIAQRKIDVVRNSQNKVAYQLKDWVRVRILAGSFDLSSEARVSENDSVVYHKLGDKTSWLFDHLKKVKVKTVSEDEVKKAMRDHLSLGHGKISDLNNLFALGLLQANYEFGMDAVEGEVIGNGTGYYDGLAAALFIDEKGEKVTTGKTIRFLDEKSLRRLYIVVVCPGMNVIIHDRYSFTEDGFGGTLVCTSDAPGAREYIGMEPAWAQGCTYDFVMACRLFGFEYDRSKNEVYMPRERKQNLFVSNVEFHLSASKRFMKKLAEA